MSGSNHFSSFWGEPKCLPKVSETKWVSVQITLCEGLIDTLGVTCTYGTGLGQNVNFGGSCPRAPCSKVPGVLSCS